ncbi:hypothetical protein [Halorussus lipolyticus]|uniref:hypothetical protein n=1 Tax=Halorussus lipolyticus TaxID=3034024 RepID=UPI0023E8D929|nr:hypothetical protein [Halorussus sp. DT80]
MPWSVFPRPDEDDTLETRKQTNRSAVGALGRANHHQTPGRPTASERAVNQPTGVG